MSTLSVNTIQAQTGTTVSVPSSQVLHAPGHVIQVVQAVTDTEVMVGTAATWTSLMTATITPKFSSSKIMIMCSAASLQRGNQTIGYRISRGGSALQLQAMYADDPTYWAGNSLCLNYLDSPATASQVTYTWEGYNHTGTYGLYWNYDNSTLESTNASITLMEIAQ